MISDGRGGIIKIRGRPGGPTCPDRDGDGYQAQTVAVPCTLDPGKKEDCDDTDPSIHPGALEVCDNYDNDCDGLVNEEVDTDPGNNPYKFGTLKVPLGTRDDDCVTKVLINQSTCEDTGGGYIGSVGHITDCTDYGMRCGEGVCS